MWGWGSSFYSLWSLRWGTSLRLLWGMRWGPSQNLRGVNSLIKWQFLKQQFCLLFLTCKISKKGIFLVSRKEFWILIVISVFKAITSFFKILISIEASATSSAWQKPKWCTYLRFHFGLVLQLIIMYLCMPTGRSVVLFFASSHFF